MPLQQFNVLLKGKEKENFNSPAKGSQHELEIKHRCNFKNFLSVSGFFSFSCVVRPVAKN